MQINHQKLEQIINLHSNTKVTSFDILIGDMEIFEYLKTLDKENPQKLSEKYQEIGQVFTSKIDILLPQCDRLKFSYDNELDIAIEKHLAKISSNFVYNEVNLLNKGRKKAYRAQLILNQSGDYEIASLIESFHLASLIQDDVIDSASTRRFVKTINSKYQNHIAVLVSDILLIQIITSIKKYVSKKVKKSDINKVGLANFLEEKINITIGSMITSEINAKSVKDELSYIDYATKKTANLFGLSAILGAISKNNCIEITKLNEVFEYGKKLGLVFQMTDDYLDYYDVSQKTGKDGNDVTNLVYNYVVVCNYNQDVIRNNISNLCKELKEELIDIGSFIIEKILRSING